MRHFTPSAIGCVLLATFALTACGGGNDDDSAPTTAVTSPPSTPAGTSPTPTPEPQANGDVTSTTGVALDPVTPDHPAANTIAISAPASATSFTAQQLRQCPMDTRSPALLSELGCLVGRFTGKVTNAQGQVLPSNKQCEVTLRANGTATLRIGPDQATHTFVTAAQIGSRAESQYQHSGDSTQSILALKSVRFNAQGGVNDGFELTANAPLVGDGVTLRALVTNQYTPQAGLGCAVSTQTNNTPPPPTTPKPGDASTPPLKTTLTVNQVNACPYSLTPLDFGQMGCIVGTYTGFAANDQGQLLEPQQTCAVTVRANGTATAWMGGRQYDHRIVTLAEQKTGSAQGSFETPVYNKLGYTQLLVSQRFDAKASITDDFGLTLYKEHGVPYATLSTRFMGAPAACAGLLTQ